MRSEKGSVLLLVTVTLTAVMGIVGLAMDVGQLYVTNQQAQAAADAAVLAGALDMFNVTGFDATGTGFTGASISCAANSTQSPCVYAQLNGFSPPDTVTINFSGCSVPPGVTVDPSPFGPANLICATVSRTVNTTFLRVLGTTMSTVTATATAAIVGTSEPTPIVITHPTLSPAFDTSGGASIVICGGPTTGIQVNSSSSTAVPADASVDLSKAGPSDPSGTCSGTGSSFRVVGNSPNPGGIKVGTSGLYVSGVSAVADPLLSVPVPAIPAAASAPISVTSGTDGCPAVPAGNCTEYSPGLYSSGIGVSNKGLFRPGIYYIQSNNGFTGQAGGCMSMTTSGLYPYTDAQGVVWNQNILVYNDPNGGHPGDFGTTGSFGNNCTVNALIGSPSNSVYQGILFFQDRSSASTTHNFQGGSNFSLTGTIYITNTTALMNAGTYQKVNMSGGSTSATAVYGEFVVSNLTLNGGSVLTMHLTAGPSGVKRVALVQ